MSIRWRKLLERDSLLRALLGVTAQEKQPLLCTIHYTDVVFHVGIGHENQDQLGVPGGSTTSESLSIAHQRMRHASGSFPVPTHLFFQHSVASEARN